ncbi:hypothetical protein K1719_004406 [Acacia pycnantha]|nr:hypothetical protein K1719_004406 [Acacia pycnantha]
MYNILYWNLHGACSRKQDQNISLVCKHDRPCLVVLSKTISEDEDRFKCLQSSGYDSLVFVLSVGRSGGIVAAWRSDQIDVVVVCLDHWFIHLKGFCDGWPPFFITSIYSIPNPLHKQLLWNGLENYSSEISIPWVVMGDFNDIVLVLEKFGGRGGNEARIRRFTDRLWRCRLSDLGSCGPKFTWKGPISMGGRRIYERLDRAIVNDAFLSSLVNSVLKVLSRTQFSDHNPICLNWENTMTRS